MFLKNFLLSYILLFFACISFTHAETDADLMASGQWRDPKTGLIWMRCLVGQKWTGKSCSGDAKNVSPEIVAAIAAAVAEMTGNKIVAIRIKTSEVWAAAGRQKLMNSH